MNNVFAFKEREAPWRRENASEETVLIDTRIIIIFQRADESGLDVQNKLNRFRAGEDVEDVHAGPPGAVDQIKVIHFVDPEGKWWNYEKYWPPSDWDRISKVTSGWAST